MATRIAICDEDMRGLKTPIRSLEFLNETITVRELIRERVYEEVREFNAGGGTEFGEFRGLVRPTEAEETLNGYRVRRSKKIDWEEQYKRAIEAFERNGFFILVDDRQASALDEKITLSPSTEVSFVKLMPLVGG
jgi:hypothetical protein